jgi:hypothetical protein
VDELGDLFMQRLHDGDVDDARRLALEAVQTARAIEVEDSIKSGALEQAGRMLANAGDVEGAVAVLSELAESDRGRAFHSMAHAYAEAGADHTAIYIWLCGFADLERTTRGLVFGALEAAASLIGDDDLLWRLCQGVLEVERWWDAPATQVAGP